MQGVAFLPPNPLQGSPPPHNSTAESAAPDQLSPVRMEKSSPSKSSSSSSARHNHTDSGIYSASQTDADMSPASVNDDDDPNDKKFIASKAEMSSVCVPSPSPAATSNPLVNKSHSCPMCESHFPSQQELTSHLRSHSLNDDRKSPITCHICYKALSSPSSLDRHLLVHSGERPFHCRYCGDTFTTNGNMHRHMRTHKSTSSDTSDSDSHDPDGEQERECNNNNNNSSNHQHKIYNFKRKLCQDNNCESSTYHHGRTIKRPKHSLSASPSSPPATPNLHKFQCPVCDRADFAHMHALDTHLEDNHPDYPAKCTQCTTTVSSYKQLAQHRHLVHSMPPTTPHKQVVGFKDLTFVDFSSQKFPHIARYECEKNVHKTYPTTGGPRFQCAKCQRAFPCSSSLRIHENDCMGPLNDVNDRGLDLSVDTSADPSHIRRNEFFARLDLLDKCPRVNVVAATVAGAMGTSDSSPPPRPPPPPPPPGPDLADIQTIITMTNNGGFMQHLSHKSESSTPADEESQDAFALEFRRMKLRGEFPCRLCTAIFPNLRALKGHNRTHLNGAHPDGMYRCNMCPHSSLDKAALIRHMRTHNGDRPYECAVCNYAFTTKANCERHLRNRHAKTTREEVKRSIIYHPSEDPTNEELNKLQTEKKNSHLVLADELGKKFHDGPITATMIPPSQPPLPSVPLPPPTVQQPSLLHSQFLRNAVKSIPPTRPPSPPPLLPPHSIMALNESQSLHENLDMPIDLSTKRNDRGSEATHKSRTIPKCGNAFPFAAFLKHLPNTNNIPDATSAAAALYATQLFCGNSLWTPATFPISPLLFPQNAPPQSPHHTLLTNDFKECLQRYQLCAGAMVPPKPDLNFSDHLKHLQHLRQVSIDNNEVNLSHSPNNASIPPIKMEFSEMNGTIPSKPLSSSSSLNSSPIATNSAVKLVIKNGILMPKQKQRRYRTERPFTCEHCSARFTLRSNMERHIKQQHPQYWSQRQRTLNNPGRKPKTNNQAYSTNHHNHGDGGLLELNIPNYDCFDNEKLRLALLQRSSDSGISMNRSEPSRYDDEDDEDRVDDEDDEDDDEDEEGECVEEEEEENEDEEEDVEEDALVIDDDKMEEQQADHHENDEDENADADDHHDLEHDMRNGSVAVIHFTGDRKEQDLVPVAQLLDNANQQQFKEFFKRVDAQTSEEDEDGLIASGSTSESTDGNRSEGDATAPPPKKKSAYSMAPNRVSCPFCNRNFPWSSSLRRHVLTHTGHKPFKCSHCPLLFTTKSNCDRHLLRKHGNCATTICTEDLVATAAVPAVMVTTTAIPSTSAVTPRPATPPNAMITPVLPPSTVPLNLRTLMPDKPHVACGVPCPSSSSSTTSSNNTFSTYVNSLKKHLNDTKHIVDDQHGYEGGSSDEDIKPIIKAERVSPPSTPNSDIPLAPAFTSTPVCATSSSDLPFKCHLCDSSFSERQDALDHIHELHQAEYDLLLAKNALDLNAQDQQQEQTHFDEALMEDNCNMNELRGRFPDYSNRKVICAFCMRRFWSAEDLRRHMRTHTGERPFSCDICRRRFTLKHSMLRHRKKHNVHFEHGTMINGLDGGMTTISHRMPSNNANEDEILSNKYQLVGSSAVKADAMDTSKSFGGADGTAKGGCVDESAIKIENDDHEDGCMNDANESSGDLISNLLGIRDRSIIDKVLTAKSADDAAKLLGVKNGAKD